MKQVVQNYRNGELTVLDVPIPACKAGGVLVASSFSLISVGTELMKVNEAKLSLLGKARARPDQMRKVVDAAREVGPVAAYQKATSRLDSYSPLGYSVAGVVVEVGAGVDEFAVGDVVACAGNEHALHAEVNWVPKNLCAKVPDEIDPRHAAFATVGAIALHGVRRAEPALGETACVIGLGLIGQLTVKLLVAAGVRVVGIDPIESRRDIALAAGAHECASPADSDIDALERSLVALTHGVGVDHVLLTASGTSSDPVHVAARLARDRAHVVDVGKCGLDLPWNAYYEKELDVRFSRSYGPGRYDPTYELDGIDYPVGYVRWTERRNLACFLDLLAAQTLDMEPLVSGVFRIDDAVEVYEQLHSGRLDGIGFLFEYPGAATGWAERRAREPSRDVDEPTKRRGVDRPISTSRSTTRVAFLGAGNYASSSLLPHLQRDARVELAHVVTTTSLSAANAQKRFGFTHASTEVDAVLEDDSIDTVFIVTRHSTHAELTCRALEHRKNVFVEKPLALSAASLQRLHDVIATTGNDRLHVGFNRRFAPMLVDMRARFGESPGPSTLRYLVNAGRLDPKSWYLRAESEGSRFEGEGGHFIDTASWWLDALPVEVFAAANGSGEDLAVTVRFDDDSLATIAYVTDGHARYPKETFEASSRGRTARLDNFRTATVWRGRRRHRRRSLAIDKGQRAQLDQFVRAAVSGGPMPIPVPTLSAVTAATLAATRSQLSGHPEAV